MLLPTGRLRFSEEIAMRLTFTQLVTATFLLIGGLALHAVGSASVRSSSRQFPRSHRSHVVWTHPHHAYVIFGVRGAPDSYILEVSIDKKPTATRTLGGSLTGFCQLDALAIGPSGNLYVSGFFGSNCQQAVEGVEEFAPGAFGNVAPIAVLSGNKTELDRIDGIALDPSGKLYVANGEGGPSYTGAITVYAAGATGNVAPIDSISGSKTGFGELNLYYVAVDDAGEVFAGLLSAGTEILKFPAGAHGNIAPLASVTVEPYGHGFNELQVSGGTVYVAVGTVRQQTPTIYELSSADLSLVGALTNPKFTILTADSDSTGKVYVQNFIRSRGDTFGYGHLYEYNPGDQNPVRIRYDGTSAGGGYIVVGP